jgi:uncharacterized phage protein (TIGR02218 family)
MRSASAALKAHLAGETTTVAYLWTVTRRDAQVLGFTSHDRDLVYGGVRHAAATGFTASQVQHRAQLNVDGLELAGFLDAAAITEADLAGGKWDGATVLVRLVNTADLSMGDVWIAGGTLGDVSQRNGQFTAEMQGLISALQRNIGRVISVHCDAILGDARCGATPTTDSQTVTAAASRRAFTTDGADAADTWTGGLCTFTSGANAGVSIEVLDSGTGGAVELILSAPYSIAAGDTVTLTEGCDKTFATCRTKFSNQNNFRGHPHVPGTDRVLKPVVIL